MDYMKITNFEDSKSKMLNKPKQPSKHGHYKLRI